MKAMEKKAWYRSGPALVAATLVLPPAGLVLLWLRPETRVLRKILGTVLITAVGVTHLFLFYGLRAEMGGEGIPRFLTFRKPEKHYAELEQSRAAAPPPPIEVPVEAPVEVPKVETSAPAATPTRAPHRPPYWTDFRGPRRDGRYDEMEILTTWPAAGLKPLWKQPVGGGYASFVVAEGRAFTIEQRRDQEVVAAYQVLTGRELWTHGWKAAFRESMGGDGPRATPTWHQGKIYAQGAEGELRCLDAATGKLVWSKNTLTDTGAPNLMWGMACSPLIVDDTVVAVSGNSLVAYDKRTGSRVWKALDEKQAYTSPMLATLDGRRQIVTVSAKRAMGLAVEDRAVLWDFPWTTTYDVNSSQPLLVGENRIFISAGYGHGAALLEVGAGGARPVWQNIRMKNKFNGSVLHEGHVYGLDEGILACVNIETGVQRWKGGRYGYGQVLLASGHLVITTETGDVVLVKATPERHQEVAQFPAIEGKTWNNPALANGLLLVRNTTEMACFRVGKLEQ
jgi:outer membrane protein assembly factor BamB